MNRYIVDGLLMFAVLAAGLVVYRTVEPRAEPMAAFFGGVSLRLDYATTNESRELGLSGRTSVPEGCGMLFVFPSDDRYGFWMKDMLVPIDMFWLDSKGQVVYMATDVATSTYPDVFYPTVPARYVLETSAGFAHEHNVTVGTPLLLKNLPTVLK